MEARIAGGEDAPPVPRVAALPSADDAARPLDDRDQREDVVGLEPGLGHEVDMAEREQAVIVAVAAEAPETHGTAQALEAACSSAENKSGWSLSGTLRRE